MDFGLAFGFVFQEMEWWKKVLIAAALLIIPVIGWLIVAGWTIEITRRVIRRSAPYLPGWDNFGKYLVDGLLFMAISIIYSLPIILFNIVFQFAAIFLDNSGQMGEGGMDALTIAVIAVLVCIGCVFIIYNLVISFGIPAAYANFAAKGRFGAAFNFREVIGLIRAAPGAYLITFLGSIVAGFASALGLIACIIGVLATSAYAMLVNAHLWGQAYNEAQRALQAEPVNQVSPNG